MTIDHDWRAEYPKVAHLYTPEEWEEYNTRPMQWCQKELGNTDPSVRFNAVDILRGLGSDGTDAIPQLALTLENDSDASVRGQAAFALRELCECVDKTSRVPVLDALRRAVEAEQDQGVLDELKDAIDRVSLLLA